MKKPEPVIQRAEWFDDRWYRIQEGQDIFVLPSVTTKLSAIAKPGLDHWRGQIGNREADMIVLNAQERGQRVHDAIRILLLGGKVLYNPPNRPNYTDAEIRKVRKELSIVLERQEEMVQAWRTIRFIQRTGAQVVAIEQPVYNRPDNYAGTLDAVFRFPEAITAGKITYPAGLYITDYKSGNEYAFSHGLQLSSYWKAWELMFGQKIDGGFIIYTKQKATDDDVRLRYMSPEAQAIAYDQFLNVSRLWDAQNPTGAPVVFEFPTMLIGVSKEKKRVKKSKPKSRRKK